MQPNTQTHAAALALDHESVSAAQVVDGAPTTGVHALTRFAGVEVGVWEMSVGGMRDVEADEVFVVLSGSARVEFADGTPALNLVGGDVVRLAAGSQTIWTVFEPLRKVYLTADS